MIFKIRKASTEDAEAIVEVFDHVPFLKDCYRGEAGISLVENKPDIFWLADLDGRVASVMIVPRKYDLGWLEISLIVTKPEFRRRDYARGLIQKAKQTRRFSKVWDHPANKRKALFLSSWNCSIARVGEGETDFKILSAKPIREKMFRGASSLRFV